VVAKPFDAPQIVAMAHEVFRRRANGGKDITAAAA